MLAGIKPLATAILFAGVACADVTVTYLANEGVMLTAPGSKVLVDALFRDSLEPYIRHPADVQDSLETGRAPYDDIRLAIATHYHLDHYHLDHWDAGAITRFLRSNPKAIFAAPSPGTAMLPSAQRPRTRPVAPESGSPQRFEAGGIEAMAIMLQHGATPHAGYDITLGGTRVMHLGDADPSPANFAELTRAGSPHVVILPFWWLNKDAVAFLRDSWKPRHVIAVHFGATDLASLAAVRAAWPGVWTCTKQGESRTY